MYNNNSNKAVLGADIFDSLHELASMQTVYARSKKRLFHGTNRQLDNCINKLRSVNSPVACTNIIIENHYTVQKAMQAKGDILKGIKNNKFTLIKRMGKPRIMQVLLILLEGCSYSVDKSKLLEAIDAFQEVSPLTDYELTLIPDMLSMLCLDLLGYVYQDAVHLLDDIQTADSLYRKISDRVSISGKEQLISQGLDSLSPTGITWLYTLFCENDDFANIEIIKKQIQLKGSDLQGEAARDRSRQLKIGELASCAVNTMRFAGSINVEQLLERYSMLNVTLRADELYNSSDITTRRSYCTMCERIAKKLKLSPVAVAKQAVALGNAGEFLFDEEKRSQLYGRLGGKLRKINGGLNLAIYIGINLLLGAFLVFLSAKKGVGAAVLTILPGLVIANALVIRIYLKFLYPRLLPRLDYKRNALPATVTAVSLLLTDKNALEDVISRLETHYLSAKLDNCYFAVLSDFKDSKTEAPTPEELELLDLAKGKIAALNKKYSAYSDIFYFFHRKGEFNKADNMFMGHERKRGAIMSFFSYVIASDEQRELIASRYMLITGDLPKCEYAVCLDSDTVMPPETLGCMIGTIMNPLNKAIVKKGKIVKGYGILVPRMECIPGNSTEFLRIQNGYCGSVPYITPVVSLFNDLFNSCIFGGKGIIDIKAFLECIGGKIDDNRILSHDMLESSFVRSGYMSDIVLYDKEPKTLISWWKRQHRWIRGDFQLLPYLFYGKNSIKHTDALTRYKILDNIRRALTPIAVFLCLALLPILGKGLHFYIALAAVLADPLLDTINAIIRLIMGKRLSTRELLISWQRGLLSLISLPYGFCRSLDACVRSVYRVCFSHKHMLEWQTAAQGDGKSKGGMLSYYPKMLISVLLGLYLLLMPLFDFSGSLILGILYLYAPFALKQFDIEQAVPKLPDKIYRYFETLAEDTWQFFLNEATADNGYIPPDNVQISPYKAPVYNTSPTNIGMAICADCCAYDLKLIDEKQLIERLTVTCDYIESLEKWNGHLYNWYDLKTRKKLTPAYVSTVDSGNLCASMLYAGQMLLELSQNELAERYRELAKAMDFTQLYDEDKSLFYIGYDELRCSLTESWYDLLASEARLTYYVACALCQIPQKGWYSLGRVLVKCADSRALVSWSGTMFEYLMPVLFLESVKDTLIDETCKAVIHQQINVAKESSTTWGVSESGYYAFDRDMYYQYKAFGELALGLSPVYDNERVLAPYACILAAMVYPTKAYSNLLMEESYGARGKYGFYEALDFTKTRGMANCQVVESFMAHHQGMSLCSLCNVLLAGAMQKRFAKIPEIKTVAMLNLEKLPDSKAVLKKYERTIISDEDNNQSQDKPQYFTEAGEQPRGIYLTNGRLCTFLTDAGLSYIKLGDIYITRFRRSLTRGKSGLFMYATCDDKVYPVLTCDALCDSANVVFTHELSRATMETKTNDFTITSRSIVANKNDGLIVRLEIANHSNTEKEFDLGAYCEISLATYEEDIAHPAFVKLTVDAERVDNLLLFRRKAKVNRQEVYCFAGFDTKTNYCAGGLHIPGRHSSYVNAQKQPLHTDTHIKSPIEPTLTARTKVRVPAGESTAVTFVLGAAFSRESALAQAKSCLTDDFNRQSAIAHAYEASALHFMGINSGKARLFNKFGTLITTGCVMKSNEVKAANLNFDSLYRFSISGKRTIVLVTISSPTQFRLLKTLLKLLRYMAYKNDPFDLVIIGGYKNSYQSDVKSYISHITAEFANCYPSNVREYLHTIDGFNLSDEEKQLLMEAASIIIDADRSLNKQLSSFAHSSAEALTANCTYSHKTGNGIDLKVENGEVVFSLYAGDDTPMPYSNILISPLNTSFGSLVTESGGGYTWKGNCQSNRVTKWYCDPLQDTQSELLFIKTTDRGYRTLVHSRLQGGDRVTVTHGYGYSKYDNPGDDISSSYTVFIDTAAPQKIGILTLANNKAKTIEVSVIYVICPDNNGKIAPDFEAGTAYIRSEQNGEWSYITLLNVDGIAVCDSPLEAGQIKSYTSFAIEGKLKLRPNEVRTVITILGMDSKEKGKRSISAINTQTAYERLDKVKRSWDSKLNVLTVETPDNSFNQLVNGRLLYQVYASRLMARTGYYQSGGAFGFRDQLQDVMALLYTEPKRAKGQILLCASKQYEEGDCMHWWHPPMTGVRTKITDDRLFLPLLCCEYAKVTGDYYVFDVQVPFLKSAEIPEGFDDLYYTAEQGTKSATVYEHCLLALFSLDNFGPHGLPLMQKSDWNDGMDNVNGESVFLAFFMLLITKKLTFVAKKRGDTATLQRLEELKQKLTQGIDTSTWDGAWFRRAYYKDGRPLGTKEDDECMIDLLSQVFACFADYDRNSTLCETALSSVESLLVDYQSGIVKLLTPSFTGSKSIDKQAGYIESYIEGVRENGGQYTHGAAWYVIALCLAGHDEKAAEIFNMLNPLNKHMNVYKQEPYTIAADVYSAVNNSGMGGWTWYTGSAAWIYIAAVRYILGLKKEGNKLSLEPHTNFDRFEIKYQFNGGQHIIKYKKNPDNQSPSITIDGRPAN